MEKLRAALPEGVIGLQNAVPKSHTEIWAGFDAAIKEHFGLPHRLPGRHPHPPGPLHLSSFFTALMPPRSSRQPRPNSDPSAPPRAPSRLVSEGGPAEWEGTSEKDRRHYQWRGGCGRPWSVDARRAAGGVAASAGGSAGDGRHGGRGQQGADRSPRRRHHLRQDHPQGDPRQYHLWGWAGAGGARPRPARSRPGRGGAVEALGSVVWRAGRDGTDGASSPRPPATSLKHRAPSGTGGWLGGCRAAGLQVLRGRPRPRSRCVSGLRVAGASGAPRVAAWRHCRPCCRLNCPGTCGGLLVKPKINRLQAISLRIQGVRTQTVHRASRRRAGLDVPLDSVMETVQLCLPGFGYEPLRGIIKGKNYSFFCFSQQSGTGQPAGCKNRFLWWGGTGSIEWCWCTTAC